MQHVVRVAIRRLAIVVSRAPRENQQQHADRADDRALIRRASEGRPVLYHDVTLVTTRIIRVTIRMTGSFPISATSAVSVEMRTIAPRLSSTAPHSTLNRQGRVPLLAVVTVARRLVLGSEIDTSCSRHPHRRPLRAGEGID